VDPGSNAATVARWASRDPEAIPQVPGLEWVSQSELRDHWPSAALVVIRPAAAPLVPADLPERPGVVVHVTHDEHHDEAWAALCRDELATYLPELHAGAGQS
jgi:hypothetical protein